MIKNSLIDGTCGHILVTVVFHLLESYFIEVINITI